ncbi:pyrroline-5-carboxylate reductase protein [Agrobacterium tumefaciens str. Cherry 2E-2-2]|nr:pyrroline-5-carboxylate reductase protein [Agrobacterium tumefaciens str. Cherry 2E-2-2]
MMAHIVLVGAGNMGFAMLKGWKAATSHEFTVIEPSDNLRKRAEAEGVESLSNLDDWTNGKADALVIATKPDTVGAIAGKAKEVLRDDGVLISVAAGKSVDLIRENLRSATPGIVRCMPNTPAAIGQGMIVCCPDANVSPLQRDLTAELMSCIGKALFVENEALMDAVTAVSGSGPAYLFHFVEALTSAAEAAGLDADVASQLAKQTVFGAASLVIGSDVTPGELRRQVTSPKGTTEAALKVLMDEKAGLTPLLISAVLAAKNRSVDLGSAQ